MGYDYSRYELVSGILFGWQVQLEALCTRVMPPVQATDASVQNKDNTLIIKWISMSEERGQFSSKLGYILVAAGSAIGLENLVAFPVMASRNGGAAFLVLYLFLVAFICYPVMLAEIATGRRTQRNPVGAFPELPAAEIYQPVHGHYYSAGIVGSVH